MYPKLNIFIFLKLQSIFYKLYLALHWPNSGVNEQNNPEIIKEQSSIWRRPNFSMVKKARIFEGISQAAAIKQLMYLSPFILDVPSDMQ